MTYDKQNFALSLDPGEYWLLADTISSLIHKVTQEREPKPGDGIRLGNAWITPVGCRRLADLLQAYLDALEDEENDFFIRDGMRTARYAQGTDNAK